MAFDATKLIQVLPMDLVNGRSLWSYYSSAGATEVVATGYFAGVATSTDGIGSRGTSHVGMRVGDVIMVQENASGTVPYRTTLHGVKSATANSTAAGYVANLAFDASVSSAATT